MGRGEADTEESHCILYPMQSEVNYMLYSHLIIMHVILLRLVQPNFGSSIIELEEYSQVKVKNVTPYHSQTAAEMSSKRWSLTSAFFCFYLIFCIDAKVSVFGREWSLK